MAEPVDPLDNYDREHGTPGKAPAEPAQTEAERWGTNVNPLRETPTPYKNLQTPSGS